MTTKREEAEQAMRYGPIVAKEEERVALLREAINEALEMAARRADEDSEHGCNPYAECTCSAYPKVAASIARDIRALKKEGP